MALQKAIVKRFDLSNGFVTEFTELNFPENATVDEENMTIEQDGSRKRRNGVDYESSYVLHSSNTWQSGDAVNVFEWRGVNGDADTNFVVVQVGGTLHFYDRDNDSFSNNKISDTVSLFSNKVTSATNTEVRQSRIDGAYGRARFFVTGEFINPFYVTWDGSNISTVGVTLKERDFEGEDDGLRIDERPSSLSNAHDYNLKNQGWSSGKISSFNSSKSVYPSNADIESLGYYNDTSSDGKRAWDADQVTNFVTGNTRAPQGHYIRNVFDTRQLFESGTQNNITGVSVNWTDSGPEDDVTFTTASNHGLVVGDSVTILDTEYSYTTDASATDTGNTDLQGTHTVDTVPTSTTFTVVQAPPGDYDSGFSATTTGSLEATAGNANGETTDARPVSVAFFAGRVWYSGIPEERLSNKVYFSQIIQFDDQIGNCYQAADPTSEEISDLIDTDGGVITIAEMGQVKKMAVVGKNLVLFAENGIWNIGPGEQGFFTATSHSIRKVSGIEVASPEAVVVAEGTPLMWANQGIYAFGEDQVSGFLQANSLTAETIQTFYRDIPDESKREAFGLFDDVAKKFYWLYSSDSNNPSKYDKCLLFDAKHEAFQKYEFKSISNGPFIAAATTTLGYDDEANKVKFLAVEENDGEFTFANLNETTFHDWVTFDSTGVDADAFLLTGYETGEDAARDKQAPKVTFLFKRTETGTDASGNLTNPGSCKLQARWDWSNSANSNKWNPERQVYRLRRNYFPGSHPSSTFEDGHPVVWSRNTVRGRGRALHMRLRSEEDYDLHLLGWQITMTGSSET